jgi:hypothetical protein
MTSSPDHPARTDSELLALDIPTLLRYGLGYPGARRTLLFGDGAVAAALTLDGYGVLPRAVAFLAKIVRSGGIRYAAALDEPLPGEAATAAVRGWLTDAAAVAHAPDAEDTAARWLEAVAAVMALRLTSGTAATRVP